MSDRYHARTVVLAAMMEGEATYVFAHLGGVVQTAPCKLQTYVAPILVKMEDLAW